MWLFVPVQEEVRKFLATLPDYPSQSGSSLSASGISYQSLQLQSVLKRLESLPAPQQ